MLVQSGASKPQQAIFPNALSSDIFSQNNGMDEQKYAEQNSRSLFIGTKESHTFEYSSPMQNSRANAHLEKETRQRNINSHTQVKDKEAEQIRRDPYEERSQNLKYSAQQKLYEDSEADASPSFKERTQSIGIPRKLFEVRNKIMNNSGHDEFRNHFSFINNGASWGTRKQNE